MLNLTFAEIQNCLNNTEVIPNFNSNSFATAMVFDTRRIALGSNCIFVALKSVNNNGHAFIDNAYQKGIRFFIVEDSWVGLKQTDAVYCVCSNTLNAIQQLAKISRSKFTGVLIALTGSNGKTIVKEWLYQLLNGNMLVYRSPRSFNSQLGVAISMLSLNTKATVAIIETGISKPGEMEILHKILKPNMAVFTHIGDAHSEFFDSMQHKINQKGLLFQNVDMAVIANDMDTSFLNPAINSNPLLKTIQWKYNGKASFILEKTTQSKSGTTLHLIHKTQPITFFIPFKDKASIHNALTCLCCLYALEQLDEDMLQKFALLQPIQNRLISTQGLRNNEIINDSYSNDLSAFTIALDYLVLQANTKEKVVIFSDFDVSIENNIQNIETINQLLIQQNIKTVFAVGSWLFANKHSLPTNVKCFNSVSDLLSSNLLNTISNASILIKGARKYGLENVSNMLENKQHKTRLQINMDAIKFNINYYKQQLKPGVKLMGMVKAMGYGTGDAEIARILQLQGAHYLGVAFVAEGIELRKQGITLPIMVLNTNAQEIATAANYDLEPVIYSLQNLAEYVAIFNKLTLNIHIELDSGMHRLGFNPNQINQIKDLLPINFIIKSIFSHLAASEDPILDAFTNEQIQTFSTFANQLNPNALHHIANTAAIQRHVNAQFNMVRLGIGIYGIATQNETIQTVCQLISVINQIKTIPAGEGIGYGLRHKNNQNTRIAIVPIGYADGLMRSINTGEKQGNMAINGQIVNIVGNICMDMCMLNVTNIDCEVGDEVEIFGSTITIQTQAKQCNTIPYEIISRISSRVKRVYIGE